MVGGQGCRGTAARGRGVAVGGVVVGVEQKKIKKIRNCVSSNYVTHVTN